MAERVADPLGLVAKGSVWYLAATVDGKARTYRASRLRAVTILDDPVSRPKDFDLATFWTETSAEFRATLPAHRFTLRVTPGGMSRVRMGWRFATVESESEPSQDGSVDVTIRADSESIAVECVLSLGGSAIVLEPAPIRDRARAAAAAMLASDGPAAGAATT